MALQVVLQPLCRGRDSPPNKINDDVFLTVPDPDDAFQTGSVTGWMLGKRQRWITDAEERKSIEEHGLMARSWMAGDEVRGMEKLRCGCQERMRESEKVQEDRGQGSGEVDGTATQSQSVARGPAAVAGPANPGGQHLQSLKSFQRWTAAFVSRGRGAKVKVREAGGRKLELWKSKGRASSGYNGLEEKNRLLRTEQTRK